MIWTWRVFVIELFFLSGVIQFGAALSCKRNWLDIIRLLSPYHSGRTEERKQCNSSMRVFDGYTMRRAGILFLLSSPRNYVDELQPRPVGMLSVANANPEPFLQPRLQPAVLEIIRFSRHLIASRPCKSLFPPKQQALEAFSPGRCRVHQIHPHVSRLPFEFQSLPFCFVSAI